MIIGSTSGIRAEWYDRNAQDVNTRSHGGQNPHTLTTQFTYTVPAGRKAWVDLLSLNLECVTPAAPRGLTYAQFSITTPTNFEIYVLWTVLTSNVAFVFASGVVNQVGYLSTGTVVKAYTYDDSTGGTVGYYCDMKVTEFDG